MGSVVALAKKGLSPAGSVFAGLLLFHGIAALALWNSNRELFALLQEVRGSGYLVVPDNLAMAGLEGPGPAFFGAFFFTLTLGAGLTIVSLAAAWTWDRLLGRRIVFIPLFALAWIAALAAAVKSEGFTLFGILALLLVSPFVFAAAVRGYWSRQAALSWRRFTPPAALIILGALWVPLLTGDSFISIRDNLLGRGAAGIVMMEGYYRYTLYPARMIQSLDQRLMKTCRLEGFHDEALERALTRLLIAREYLVLKDERASVDLVIRSRQGGMVSLDREEVSLVRTTVGEFLRSPDPFLQDYSLLTDKAGLLRPVIFYCLLVASPLLLYLALFWFYLRLSRPFVMKNEGSSMVAASILCLLTGGALLLLSHLGPSLPEGDSLERSLASSLSSNRVAALRAAQKQGFDMSDHRDYGEYVAAVEKLPPLERYWLARALGQSRSDAARDDLLRLADDPLAIVSTMAYRSLAAGDNRELAPLILDRMERNPHWYSQIEAYRTLRMLGWKQELP